MGYNGNVIPYLVSLRGERCKWRETVGTPRRTQKMGEAQKTRHAAFCPVLRHDPIWPSCDRLVLHHGPGSHPRNGRLEVFFGRMGQGFVRMPRAVDVNWSDRGNPHVV